MIPSFGEKLGRMAVIDTAQLAESLGFASAWLSDHLALPREDAGRYGHMLEAMTTLSYLAGSTRRLRLGISALVLPQRNPLEVAKQVATIDVLSAGRTLLAVGAGWSQGEFENLGYDFRSRFDRLEDGIKVLRTLWRGRPVASYQGQYYHFKDVPFSPAPVQAGGPPLWVAGDTPGALRRAILLADGWHPHTLPAVKLAQALASQRALLGRRPFTVSYRTHLRFGDDPSPAGCLCGGPADILAAVQALQAAGVNYLVVSFDADGQVERERAMRTFAQEILPA
ncbi:MAG: TIGR03619 family F420-dependent LLM class oxidoreductase, partial [Chloroflexi bacterium]|nr:TIGR03619 family F420-dependent LLM class oxidoreductase [Chloroflexota bacterium]